MISEVDLRDWDRIPLKECAERVNHHADPFDIGTLMFWDLWRAVDELRVKQMQSVPALLRKKD